MRGLMRCALWTAVVAGCLLAWWFPARTLFRVEPVNMALRYEGEQVPSWFPDAMGLARELIRRDRVLPPLPEFIAGEVGGRVAGAEWTRVWDAATGAGGAVPVRFFACDELPKLGGEWSSLLLELDQPGQYRHVGVTRLEPGDRARKEAPHSVRFPARRYGVLIAAVLGGAILAPALRTAARSRVERTSAYQGVRAGVMIFLCGVALAGAPFLYGIPELFGILVIGGFVAIVGVITACVFGLQLRVVRAMLGGRDVIASWTCGADEWRRFVVADHRENRAAKWGLFLFVGGLCLAAGVAMFLADHDAGRFVLLVMLGVVVLLAVVAFAVPAVVFRRRLRETGEIVVGRRGLYLNGEVHTWGMLGSELKSVTWQAEPVPALAFSYSFLTRYGTQEATVRVPVPAGREDAAARVVDAFGMR